MNRLLTLMLATLLLVSGGQGALSVSVVQHDTDVQSTYDNLKVCSCGSTTDVIRVKNVGQLQATYMYELQSDQPWFTLDRNGDTLQPGQTDEFYVYTNTPCGTMEVGSYSVYVASEYGRYRAIEKTVEAGVCENIRTWISPRIATVEPCAEQTFDIYVTNVGTFRDTYQVSGLSDDFVDLQPGESTVVQQTFVASCEQWGTNDLLFTIKSQRNALSVDQIATVTVPRAFDFSLGVERPASPVCLDVTSVLPVTVKNIEDRANTFTLTADPWTQGTTLALEGGEEKTVGLPFTPTRDGERTVTVTALGGNGSIEKQASVAVAVEACYGLQVTAPSTLQACAGDLVLPFTIESQGTQTQEVTFDVKSNVTTKLSSAGDTLYPSRTLTPSVELRVPDADRSYYVTLEATATHASVQATTNIDAYSTETCYYAAPTSHKFRVYTDQTVLPVVIHHDGIQPATYDVHYEGTFITPLEQQITLLPGAQAVLHLAVSSEGHETGRYVDRLTLASHGVDYTTDFEITLREKGSWQRFVDAWRWGGDFWFCSIASIIALLILLVATVFIIGVLLGFWKYNNPLWLSKQTAGIVGAALLIVLLVLLIVSAPKLSRTYERPLAPNPGDLFFEMGTGMQTQLDLTQYFADPDNDSLRFVTANQPEHLLIDIQGNAAMIKPRGSWSGEETIVFTASDGRSGMTDSDLIRVSVVPYKPITFLEYWTRACWFITWLFLFLAVALLTMLALGARQARKHSPPKGEAQELIELGERQPAVEMMPPGTSPTTLIGTQVQAQNIIVQKPSEELWVASEDGAKFHRMSCTIVRHMPTDKRIIFATREEAIKAGYTPCKTCRSHE